MGISPRDSRTEGEPRSGFVGSSWLLCTVWAVIGGLILLLDVLEHPGWSLGRIALAGLGIWLAGLPLVLGGSGVKVETAWRTAFARTGVRVAAVVMAALWVLSADLFGTFAAMIILAAAGFMSLLIARAGARSLAATLVNTAVLTVSVTLALGALEGVLRLPSVAAQLGTPAEGARWFERYDRLWQKNTLGFRSHHETITRRPETLRVLALGDSFTWGDKIASSDSTWPAALERGLARELPDREVEVINMGRNGFTTANEAELLRRLGWDFDPDAVIVQFYLNDVLPSGPNYQRVASTYLAPRRSLLPGAFRRGSVAESALLDLLERRYSELVNRLPADPWSPLYRDGFAGWEQLKDALYEMGASAADRGVPIYFIVFPALVPGSWRAESHRDRGIHQQVMSVAKAAGMRIVDLTTVFGDGHTDARSWWATPYDQHPNERAHEVVAKTLIQAMIADGAVPGSGIRDAAPCACPNERERDAGPVAHAISAHD